MMMADPGNEPLPTEDDADDVSEASATTDSGGGGRGDPDKPTTPKPAIPGE